MPRNPVDRRSLRDPELNTTKKSFMVYGSAFIPDLPFIRLYPVARNQPKFIWEHSKEEIALFGYGITEKWVTKKVNRFEFIHNQIENISFGCINITEDLPEYVRPRIFGGFSFSTKESPDGYWDDFESATFILPRYLVTRISGETFLTVSAMCKSEPQLKDIILEIQKEIRIVIMGFSHAGNEDTCNDIYRSTVRSGDVRALFDYPSWNHNILNAIEQIKAGRLKKVVLARAIQFSIPDDFNPAPAMKKLSEEYPDCFRFLFEPMKGQIFFGASPELLARVSGDRLETVALAGSTRRGVSSEEDEWLAEKLLLDTKNLMEHRIVVEEILKRCQAITKNVEWKPAPKVVQFKNIQHLQTRISGKLNSGIGILKVVEKLHPTPAVAGFPQSEAFDTINTLEPFNRGFYAGPIGWIDLQGNGVFAVGIRSAIIKNHKCQVFAGAGILGESDPQMEWDETRIKLDPILDAMGVILDDEK